MSIKRQAPSDLNHENWDQEEPEDQKEMGKFQAAPKDVLEKRVMRTAKRRNPGSTNEPGKSVFSGFGGFNKTQRSSFDFLANLTYVSKNGNESNDENNSETYVASGLFSNKPTSPTEGLFKVPASTPSKLSPTTQSTTSPFGAASKMSPSSLFSAKPDSSSVNDSPFKMQTISTSDDSKPNVTLASKSPIASNLFGISSTSTTDSKPSNSTPFKIQPCAVSSSTTAMVQTSFGTSTKAATSNNPEKKADDKPDEKKIKYYSKLKGLNESVSDWISKHVTQTPLCILSPIFRDYEKYLKEMTEELQSVDETNEKVEPEVPKVANDSKTATPFGINNTGSPFGSSNPTPKPSVFGAQKSISSSTDTNSSFSFGIKTSANSTSNTTTTSTGFSFGVTTSTASPTPSPFTINNDTSANQSSKTPFSFGVGKPFSFNSNNVQQISTDTATENAEDEPPKVEYTPVKEDNSVFEKKCKIFVKKDNNFADKGVGTLYIKKIEESGKHQLLVRANTNLGAVLLNLVLASAIPTQRMGKNNVMLVCIPTPDAKPPPTPVLIRVKTAEEADDLLETLNKYKG